MEFGYYLLEQLKKHASIKPRDVVKMCYQASFGAEHLLADIEAAKRYFYSEYESVDASTEELVEEISDDICRVNLRAWKASAMPADWLFNMFVHSASVPHGSRELFLDYLKEAEKVLEGADVTFSMDEWKAFVSEYKAGDMTAVHHSEIYRGNEKPAYRIISSKFIRTLPILKEAAGKALFKASAGIIAIDGRAAAGKTTLAKLLKVILEAEVIHMDDFFLPPLLRSAERFEEPGGNVDYERFIEEVLPKLSCRDSFTYRIFDCGIMDYNGERKIESSGWRIVEGSYSHHPKFGDYADVKVFLSVEPDEQMRRIVARNGEEMAKMFRTRWIPLEEKYFANCKICDIM